MDHANAPPTGPQPPGPAAPAAPHQARPTRTLLALLLPAALVLLLLALLAGGLFGGGRWLLATPEGTAWLLARLPMVQVEGFEGAALGGRWRARSLRVQWDDGRQWMQVRDLEADGLHWQWRPNRHAWLALRADRVAARSLDVHTGPPSGQPFVLPERITLPVQLALAQVRVGSVQVDAQAPVTDVQADTLVLDARPGESHSATRVAAQAHGLVIEGDLRIATTAPMALAARATLRPALDGDAPRWAAALRAGGSVQALALAGTLRGVPRLDAAQRQVAAAPAVDLAAELRPLRTWPLQRLDLRTEALDLSALSPRLPATRLAGQAQLRGGEGSTPLAAAVELRNTLPGRWNEGRLPVGRLAFELSGTLDRRERIELPRFEADFADAARGAGRLRGRAVWAGPELTLDARLDELTPQRLDGRAAAMTVSGPVALTLRGLRQPLDPTSAPAAVEPQLRWKLDLQGRLDAAPQPVRLQLEGQADDRHFELSHARAEAGAATAEMKATLRRAAPGRSAPWLLATSGTVGSFDPLPWWPGDAADTAWQRGPHRLSGGWTLELRLPADAERLKPLVLAQRIAGNGTLQLRDSLLAGVPLAADVALAYAPAPGQAAPGTLRADVNVGGNQLSLDARGDPADGSSGAADRLQAELKAENLATLAPLLRLVPALAEWAPRQGSASATLAAEGRWPRLRTEGQLRLSQLQAGPLALARANAQWQLGFGSADAPLVAQLELAGITHGQRRADHLRLDLRGTLADHRLVASGALPLLPPPIAEQMLAIRAQSGTRALLQARGSWLADAAAGPTAGTWRTRVDRLVIGSWDGSASTEPPASGWAELRDFSAELGLGPGLQLQTLAADAGRLRIGGALGTASSGDALALRWDAVRIDLRGPQPLIQLRADVEPFLLAPLLARAQPGMGWAGDLKLAARIDIRAAERMDAEVSVERREGDLHMASGEGMQLLGLTDVRLSLVAHDGTWVFTPRLRGRSLGDITGRIEARTTPERRWPHADAPLEGSVQAQVADLGIWSAWVPPGWRLGGELRTLASVGGRFGQPQVTGEITGNNIAVRNLLQGVNVSEGNVVVRLQGDHARIERFSLRGGDGRLDVTGGATLGSKPVLQLQFAAERFRVLGRVDRSVVASGRAELQHGADGGRLQARLRIDEGLFDASRRDAPALDDDVTVRRPGAPDEPLGEAAAPAPRRNFALDAEVDLGEKLHVRGRGLDTLLRGQLRLTTPGGRLAVAGTIATEGGTYKAYGQNLIIERGLLAFSGPADNPRLDVLALRPNIDQRVGVQITGFLSAPRVRLFSEPEMNDTDKLAWLVLGRAPDGLGRNDTALLQRAAVALLSGESEAPTDQLMKALGIDEVSLRQSGEGDVRETVITIGKQLSRRWYLGYERGVNSTTGTWQLIYRIAQRFTLRLQSGLENAADVIWTWRLQETPADPAMRKSIVTPP
jgi:translocation and assembly module TamB